MKRRMLFCRAQKTDAGFTLIEVVVALLLVATGLLGYGALLNVTHKNASSGLLRTQATILAYDMLERMRANRADVLANPTHYVLPQTSPIRCADAAYTATADLYKEDLRQFDCLLTNNLPGATVTLTYTPPGATPGPTDNLVNISITWDDSRGTSGSATQNFSVQSRL